jgi:CelD/BcsL family acetyltransferase involved in cellulose biosynthesis
LNRNPAEVSADTGIDHGGGLAQHGRTAIRQPRNRSRAASGLESGTRPYASILIARDLAEFAAFWPRSDAPGAGRQFIFQCADVLQVWCDSIGREQGIEPLFVAVTDDAGRPLLLLPLGLERRRGLRILGFLDGTVSDFNAPVVFEPARDWDRATIEALWQDITRRLPPFDLAMLCKLPELVEDWSNPLRHLATAASTQNSYVMTLPRQWRARDVLPDLKDSRRRARKLARLGKVRFCIANTVAEAEAYTAAAIRLKRRKFVELLGADRFAVEPGYADYYTDISRRLFDTGTVHAAVLMLEDKVLAAQWGFAFQNRFYHLLTAYDGSGDWPRYSPGRLLSEHLMERSAKAGTAAFDFGVGDEPYKAKYADIYRPLYDAVLPVTLRGRLYAVLVTLRRGLASRLRHTRFAPWGRRLLQRWGS